MIKSVCDDNNGVPIEDAGRTVAMSYVLAKYVVGYYQRPSPPSLPYSLQSNTTQYCF